MDKSQCKIGVSLEDFPAPAGHVSPRYVVKFTQTVPSGWIGYNGAPVTEFVVQELVTRDPETANEFARNFAADIRIKAEKQEAEQKGKGK